MPVGMGGRRDPLRCGLTPLRADDRRYRHVPDRLFHDRGSPDVLQMTKPAFRDCRSAWADMKLPAFVLFAAMIGSSSPAAAVEQCRFINPRVDREACYDRQEKALAAKRK